VGNLVCLSRGVQVVSVTWRAATRIMARVGDLLQRTEDGQAQVGYSVAGRSGGRVTPCVVCTMHMETRSTSFLVEPQNKVDGFSRFGIKTGGDSFSRFSLKIGGFRFSGLGLKTGSSSLVIWV
jgi:hypothetical protein